MLISAVKLADDQSGDLIVRVYESSGGRASSEIRVALPVTSVTEADLLERPGEPLGYSPADNGASVCLTLRPFQVRTLRIAPAGSDAARSGDR